jgi:hypothetical protein
MMYFDVWKGGKLFLLVSFCILVAASESGAQSIAKTSNNTFVPAVPHLWDDQAMSTLEVVSPSPAGSARHAPAEYYYSIPVRPIYQSYPIYAPGHEPPGYMAWLRRQEPAAVWDDSHRPPLQTKADWIKAGEIIFDSASVFNFPETAAEVRDPAWYKTAGVPVARDGIMPVDRYVIRKKGEVELGGLSCATCHTRIMPDGSLLKGAQGNFPLDRITAYRFRDDPSFGGHPRALGFARGYERFLFTTPWVQPDPLADLDEMSSDALAARHAAIPPGVVARHGTSPLYPTQVPDLIGVKGRRYLDRTGLEQHRGIVDLMRYAALNQGGDSLTNFNGFIPSDFPNFKKLPDPTKLFVPGRYSDEQLYALSLYLYSLHPPSNPNRVDVLSRRGQTVFRRAGCPACHTPPLYTNNKLTPATGFTSSPDARNKYDILPISVGTDPNLTMKTRRGTGYYKVPSLQGVWYRGMFGHSGWCATLEDWFDARRTRDDYVPTGFKPYDAKTYPVKGHPFGLDLSAEDRGALIAFLKTL